MASDFMEAITAELGWWPADPLGRWTTAMLERAVGEGAASSQPAVLQVWIGKDVLGIRCWAERNLNVMQEKVRECMCMDDSCLVLLGDQEREMEGEELPAGCVGARQVSEILAAVLKTVCSICQ